MKTTIYLLLFVGFPLLSITGCEGITWLSGTITDPDNSPVKGAKVILYEINPDAAIKESTEGLSNEKGEYEVMLTHAPGRDLNLKLSVSKKGYVPHNQKIKSGETNKSFNIILEPEK